MTLALQYSNLARVLRQLGETTQAAEAAATAPSASTGHPFGVAGHDWAAVRVLSHNRISETGTAMSLGSSTNAALSIIRNSARHNKQG